MDKLSAVIITHNEEKNIARCINSLLEIADEIVILDSFSDDKTRKVCEKYNVTFIESKWLGYSESKNLANQNAKFDYILSLDADEELSQELRDSIKQQKSSGFKGAYSFNRLSNYCGSWIRHGDWYPDRKMRLWNKNEGEWKGSIHEKVELNSGVKIKLLKGDLNHYSYYNISEHIQQINKYSELSAKDLLKRNKKGGFIKLTFSPIIQFLNSFVFKLGFLDGFNGFAIALITSFGTFLKYAKLREKRRAKN